MDTADSDLVRDLFARRRVLALSLVIDGEPYVGQVAFAARADLSGLLIHVSDLARHSRGLVEGASFAALLQGEDAAGGDPLQIPRLTVYGTVREIEKGSDEYREGKNLYLDRLPSGQVTFSLGDFRLVELVVERARLVAGFGRTANLTKATLAVAARAGGEAATAGNLTPRGGRS